MPTASAARPPVSTELGRLWFVGALPPPLNGQSNYNRAMLDYLVATGTPMRLCDTQGAGLAKLWHTLRAAIALAVAGRRGDRAYLSVPGQNGVWLFAILAVILRLRGIEHYVHHHSFRPINCGPARAMRAFVTAGGRRQRHVLLSDGMRRRFAALYLRGADDDRAMALSNAYLFGPRFQCDPRPGRPVTLGHLSVLTREKGVSYLLRLFDDLVGRGHDWRLVIAGPCGDPTLAAELADATAARPDRIEYRGSVEGAEKERFFADIDLFVLPTSLIDEAEPLVMLEAFGRGVEVVASERGCIADRIRTPDNLLLLERDADCVRIENRVAAMARDWAAARLACVDHARAIKAMADIEATAFFARLLRLPAADRL